MAITDEVIAFRDERDWARYHTPENLAAAIAIEAGELQECFLWGRKPDWHAVANELADVLIFAHTLCHEMGVSPESIMRRKMALNAEKYPATEAHTW